MDCVGNRGDDSHGMRTLWLWMRDESSRRIMFMGIKILDNVPH